MSNVIKKSRLTASYSFKIINGILAITDNDGKGASVTNAVESVLAEIAEQLKVPFPSIVISRDSLGIRDGIRHESGVFKGFYFIHETELDRALAVAASKAEAGV
jgi:hypothetical protein